MLARQASWRSWQTAISTLVVVAAGCQLGNQGLPKDPLFASRKPVEARAQLTAPTAIASSEPAMPSEPAVAVARRRGQKSVPGNLTSAPRPFKAGPAPPNVHPPVNDPPD